MKEKRGSRSLYFLAFLLIVFLIHSVSVVAISATAGANSTSGKAPLAVQFIGSASGANGSVTYKWDLNGDGTFETTAQSPATVYNTAGTYNVKLNASDSSGSDIKTLTITVEPAANPSISVSQELITDDPELGEIVTFEVTITNDGDVDLEDIGLTAEFDDDEIDFDEAAPEEDDDNGDEVLWLDLGDLDVDESITVEINFTAEEEGTTSNQVTATGDYGSTTVSDSDSESVTITVVDDEDPEVILDSPADGYNTTDRYIYFRWNVTDNHAETLLCNLTVDDEVAREDIDVDNNTMKSKKITLDVGNYTWKVSCWDTNGNTDTSTEWEVHIVDEVAHITHAFNLDTISIYTQYIDEGDSVSLTYSGKAYIFTLKEVYASSVQLYADSLSERYYPSETKSVSLDLDLDDDLDIDISVISVEPASRAKLRFALRGAIEEPEEENTTETNTTEVEELAADINESEVLNVSVVKKVEPMNVTETPEDSQEALNDLIEIRQRVKAAEAERAEASAWVKTKNKVAETYNKVLTKPGYLLGGFAALLALAVVVVIVLRRGSAPTAPPPPSVPKQLMDFIETAVRDGVHKGEISSSLVKAGWSDREINRALLFARTRLDIEKKMDPELIRSDLAAEGWKPLQIREAFTYFNVKINLKKDLPIGDIQKALVDKGVPHEEINRSVLYNKMMDSEEGMSADVLHKMLRKKGWSKDNINKALFYAYVKRKLNEGLELGKIQKELLKEGKDQGEIKKMIKEMKKKL